MNATQLANAVVIYQQEDGRQGLRPSGGFLPKKSWPIAVASEQGVTLLPGADVRPEVLEDAQALLGVAEEHTSRIHADALSTMLLSLPKDSLIAFDISRGGSDAGKRLLQLCTDLFRGRNFDVVAFDDASANSYTRAVPIVRQGGKAGYTALGRYVDEHAADAPEVVVVTEGSGAHYRPTSPEKWTWIVPTSGQAWMSTTDPAMKVVRVTEVPTS